MIQKQKISLYSSFAEIIPKKTAKTYYLYLGCLFLAVFLLCGCATEEPLGQVPKDATIDNSSDVTTQDDHNNITNDIPKDGVEGTTEHDYNYNYDYNNEIVATEESFEGESPDGVAFENDLSAGDRQAGNDIDSNNIPDSVAMIRAGYAEYRVRDISKTLYEVNTLADQYEAWLEGSSHSSGTSVNNDIGNHKKQISLHYRVEQSQFVNFSEELQELPGLEIFNMNTQDVGDQIVDLEARLKAAYIREDRLLDMFDEATNVQEMLSVEGELSRARTDIESLQARLENLEDSVTWSRMHILIQEDVVSGIVEKTGWDEFLHAWEDGWVYWSSLGLSFFLIVVRGWPFLLVVVAIGWLMRKKIKSSFFSFKSKNKTNNPNSSELSDK